ncbi:MurR/RpiR family transcriptional regulator [Vibrio tapetis subsp. quintayensis]|uniref:MurR/RpiR family transcriptional regulator n=1 Tax=Vibrio tapetis TaxID=52443 RepID=UPI0025B426FA|nr:MurR/RpiR family transcriptional regulator [Vibrio tapetis]MDN3683104.1 MurR/RpiR family transcriptional regulator [Vibrio tapetis subsp. quintayensis]
MNKQDFIDSVNSMDSLTSTEKIIVAYFIKHYTMLPFAKMDELCKQIGVGKATLGRFLQRLGFSGFIDFKKHVSDDLVQVLTTPIDRCETTLPSDNNSNILAKHFQEVTANMQTTFDTISQSDFDLAVTCMKNPNGKLYVMGSASAEALSNYFYLLARYLRKEVILLKADASTLPHQLVDVTKDDCLFAISYHRFSSITVRTVRWFSENGGKVITITDQQVNPFVSYSDIEFTVESLSEGLFNNRTSGFVLIEAFIKALSSTSNISPRFSRIEGIFSEFDIFKT